MKRGIKHNNISSDSIHHSGIISQPGRNQFFRRSTVNLWYMAAIMIYMVVVISPVRASPFDNTISLLGLNQPAVRPYVFDYMPKTYLQPTTALGVHSNIFQGRFPQFPSRQQYRNRLFTPINRPTYTYYDPPYGMDPFDLSHIYSPFSSRSKMLWMKASNPAGYSPLLPYDSKIQSQGFNHRIYQMNL